MKKFSIILLHYNQMQYIKEALDSVLNQKYRNIELIIADDCSPTFDRKKVEKYIKNKNKKNFEYKILDSKQNVGTVKNLNNAVRQATGDFILFFAADDRLYDENVISNFIKCFEDKNKNIITSQCILYDEKLDRKLCNFVNKYEAWVLNKKTSRDMYARMAIGCCYGSGATAYRKEVFKKWGLFDEKYIYVEDLAYWLRILRDGEKMYYSNFNTLCHRDGGISHSEYSEYTLPKHVKQYYYDLLNIYKNEIFPFFDKFKLVEKYKILCQFHETATHFCLFVPELSCYLDDYEKLKHSSKLFWKATLPFRNFKTYIFVKVCALIKYNKVITLSFLLWLLSNIFIVNNLKIENYNILFTIYIINYFLLYGVVYALYNAIQFIKYRKTGGLHV